MWHTNTQHIRTYRSALQTQTTIYLKLSQPYVFHPFNITFLIVKTIAASITHIPHTGCLTKLSALGYLLFSRLLLIQIAKVGTVIKNSGNLLHDRHKNFENRFRNSWDHWGQSCYCFQKNFKTIPTFVIWMSRSWQKSK